MSITDNILAAYRAGVSTKKEDKLILKEISENDSFSDMLDVFDEVDAIDGMDELRNEFNESIDNISDLHDFQINIK
ncbi:MAG: hypothetical protein NC548_36285 [Lachnospiraceae bacterium]|nr:hypothetical protein [Lachnospiraceae bacterium]MCM1373302.1 hypothetical protein [Bacteroides sp.]